MTTTTTPFIDSNPSPTIQVVERGRHRRRFEVDASQPDPTGNRVKQAAEEVLRHIAAEKSMENVENVLDVRHKNFFGFSESVARTVKASSRVLGYGVSKFEDVEW